MKRCIFVKIGKCRRLKGTGHQIRSDVFACNAVLIPPLGLLRQSFQWHHLADFQRSMVTGVPTTTAWWRIGASGFGRRMQPCEAGSPG